ncbi:MAG: serine--tRNA ligase, partial [Halanaerobiales bacterium]|nr:serine--tRNA ligase [Halanaerobiales bacterium]
MLDMRFIRENSEIVEEALKKRNMESPVPEFQKLDDKRRDLLYEAEQLKHERNVNSDKIGELKRNGEDASDLIKKMQEVSARIKELDQQISVVEKKLDDILLAIPNIPHESVPVGTDEE